jgi:hypothetical protein
VWWRRHRVLPATVNLCPGRAAVRRLHPRIVPDRSPAPCQRLLQHARTRCDYRVSVHRARIVQGLWHRRCDIPDDRPSADSDRRGDGLGDRAGKTGGRSSPTGADCFTAPARVLLRSASLGRSACGACFALIVAPTDCGIKSILELQLEGGGLDLKYRIMTSLRRRSCRR